MNVAGIILAAGLSRRLGRPKQLLQLDGQPLIRVTASQAVASRLNPIVIVTGAEAGQVKAAVSDLRVTTIFNPEFAAGQSTSLRAGLESVPADADAAVFLLGDQPEVVPEIIEALIAEFEATGAAIVQPLYGSTPGNPVLFARSLFFELAQITGDQGARSLMQTHKELILRVPSDVSSPPGDVDSESDYLALVTRWESRKRGLRPTD